MTQYLLAIWDYEAEGEFELSFKQGDIIKLLEKHNEDWYGICKRLYEYSFNRILVGGKVTDDSTCQRSLCF